MRPNKLECLYLAITFQPSLTFAGNTSGLYYKHVTIVNCASSFVNKLKASLNYDARVIIYDCHMLMVHSLKLTKEGSSNWVDSGLAIKF